MTTTKQTLDCHKECLTCTHGTFHDGGEINHGFRVCEFRCSNGVVTKISMRSDDAQDLTDKLNKFFRDL